MQHLTPIADAEAQSSAPLAQQLAALLRYRWLILIVTAVVVAAVTFITLRMPKRYEAVATLEYDPSPTQPLGQSVQDIAAPVSNFLMSKEFFETQNRIIASRAVAERVVKDLGLDHDPSFFGVPPSERASWKPPSVDVAAALLQKKLVVDPVKDTRLVHLRVRDTNPERAASLANAIAHAYIEKTMQDRLGSTVDALDWLGKQLDTARKDLSEAELALYDFKKSHHILSVSLHDRQNIVAEEIQSYNERLTRARIHRIELEARVKRLEHADKDHPENLAASVFGDDPALADLRTDIREKAAKEASLSIRYGPEHPKIKELQSQLVVMRKELNDALTGLMASSRADLAEVRAVEAGMSRALADAQQAGLRLNLREIEYDRLNRKRTNDEKLYDLLLKRTTETNLTRLLRTTHVRVVDDALVPHQAVAPKVSLNVAAGLLGGGLLGVCIALLLGMLDRRLRTVADVEALGLTVLGILPRMDAPGRTKKRREARGAVDPSTAVERVVHTHPMSAAAESCRTVRTNLTFMSATESLRSLVVTSASPQDGKTTVACNLGIAFAQSGQRVLLIDGDLRKPRLHRVFGLDDEDGFSTALAVQRGLDDIIQQTDVPNLSVLPCGPVPPNPAELPHTERLKRLLDDALSRYDRVIFDSAPLGAVTDAAILAPQCGGAILVVKARQTTREAVRAALRHLRDVQARLVGGVLNDVDLRMDGSRDYYAYYQHADDQPASQTRAASSNQSAA